MTHPTVTRRELMHLTATGAGAASLSGWFAPLAVRAAEQAARGVKHKACVLLWMDGGPSHVDTFDPKPDASTSIRGDLKAIPTTVPGLMVCEKFPRLAGLMKHAALLRGMATEEADHGRARVYMHTGYKPGASGTVFPGLGSIVSGELGNVDSPLPNFVVTGTPLNKHNFITNPGYRGPLHQPLTLADPAKGLDDLVPTVPTQEFDERINVLQELEQGFARTRQAAAVESRRATVGRVLQLMRSGRGKAFDISLEPAAAREAYGDTGFGRGCLLARRLLEAGVPFVEVYLANWDSHDRKVADETKNLMTQVDLGLSALLRDLSDRGLLDSTLIVWMGEFGRTPRIGQGGGRDHYQHAWSTALFGGGIKGGQAIGRTDKEGATVADRPISVRDFMATICKVLGINHDKSITTPGGRPVRIVDKGEKVIEELFA
jgi:uncharacterized protein (DUF1501 family)